MGTYIYIYTLILSSNFFYNKITLIESANKNYHINDINKIHLICFIIFFVVIQNEESYVCILSHRTGDTILFHHEGGVDIGDVDSKALRLEVSVGQTLTSTAVKETLLKNVAADKKQ